MNGIFCSGSAADGSRSRTAGGRLARQRVWPIHFNGLGTVWRVGGGWFRLAGVWRRILDQLMERGVDEEEWGFGGRQGSDSLIRSHESSFKFPN